MKSAIVWSIILIYETVSILAILLVKGLIQRYAFDYGFLPQCDEIDDMFNSNTALYETYANYDKPYVKLG